MIIIYEDFTKSSQSIYQKQKITTVQPDISNQKTYSSESNYQ